MFNLLAFVWSVFVILAINVLYFGVALPRLYEGGWLHIVGGWFFAVTLICMTLGYCRLAARFVRQNFFKTQERK